MFKNLHKLSEFITNLRVNYKRIELNWYDWIWIL